MYAQSSELAWQEQTPWHFAGNEGHLSIASGFGRKSDWKPCYNDCPKTVGIGKETVS